MHGRKEELFMNNVTLNISLRKDLLSDIDREARSESRSRSELIREAARLYIDKKRRWNDIFRFGREQAERLKLAEDDVEYEVRRVRKERKKA